jgi:hypothetical protein
MAVDSSPAGATWAAVLDGSGAVATVDLATGVRSVRGALPGSVRWLVAAFDRLLIGRLVGAAVEVTAYAHATLAPVWTARVPVPQTVHQDRLGDVLLRACGDLVCVIGDDTVALDPATGGTRWRSARSAYVAVPGGLLAGEPGSPNAPGSTRVELHDPTTGGVRADLDSWRLIGIDEAHDRLLVGEAAGATAIDSTVLAWLTPGGLAPFAVLAGRYDTCQVVADRLVCLTNVDELHVFAVP